MTSTVPLRKSETLLPAPAGTRWHFNEFRTIGELGVLELYPDDPTIEFRGLGLARRKISKRKHEYVWALASEPVDSPRGMRRASRRCIRAYWAGVTHRARTVRATALVQLAVEASS